jgi:M6 family metalloprotease-like protein
LKFGRYVVLICLLYSYLVPQENVHICALRVQFQEDNNELTTGTGRLMMDSAHVVPFTIDPPPHNRAYFQDQIAAVHHYYQQASSGKLAVTGSVFPLQQDSAYTMPHTMGYYSPNRTEEENNRRLAELFIDAVTKADQDDAVAFADYDLVVIFHAGVGKDIDLGYDATPQDIPSLYVSPGFFKKALGDTFGGIPVDAGSLLLEQGIILPETESQEGIEVALTGIFAANIGTHLGMYDLFSPSEQTTGIGRFGLMDAGLFNLYGLAPALPSAFSRQLVGWENPVHISQPQKDIPLIRLTGNRNSGVTCYRVPINSDEYFLLEYRGSYTVSIAIDSLYQAMFDTRGEPPTYLEVLHRLYPDKIQIASTGVVVGVENYDWGLPGSGILIWHIDEQRISETDEQNAINDDPERRTVDMEEADGSQDIGQIYDITQPGYQSELGTWLDFWFKSNPAPLYKNEFSAETAPNTFSNRNYADSHIRLYDFSDNKADIMTFTFENETYLKGFPVNLDTSNASGNMIMAAVENIETPVIFTSDIGGNIYAITQNGSGIYQPDVLILWRFSGENQPVLTLADRNNNHRADLVAAADAEGRVELYDLTRARLDTTLQLASGLILPLITQTPFFYAGYKEGKIERYAFTGVMDSVYRYNHTIEGFAVVSPQNIFVNTDGLYGPFVIDLNGNGYLDMVVIQDSRLLSLQVDGKKDLVHLPASCVAKPAFADVDRDGYFEMILTLSDQLLVLNANGTPVDGFPFMPRKMELIDLIGTPLIFSTNKDQYFTIIGHGRNGTSFACDNKGKTMPDFSFTIGDVLGKSGALGDIDGDGFLDYFMLNDRGLLQGWRLDASISDCRLWWAQSSYDFTHNPYIPDKLPSLPPKNSELMPAHRVYNYPNPNKNAFTILRYYLREEAYVSIKIFDLAGDLVDSFPGPGSGNSENEIRWDLTDIASGIYLARIEAKSASATEAHIIKIMVVH